MAPRKAAKRAAKRKPKRGRPVTTGKGDLVGVRIHEPFSSQVEEWRAADPGKLSRPGAIVRLATIGLAFIRGGNAEAAQLARGEGA